MVGYWDHPVVHLFICLSVCDAMHWCTRLKVTPAGMFLFVPSDTFPVGCVV